jgi:hypothetical protein
MDIMRVWGLPPPQFPTEITSMTALLVVLWMVAVGRGHAHDGRWFAIQTSGMAFFGGLTLLALPVDERAAGVIAGNGFFTMGFGTGITS